MKSYQVLFHVSQGDPEAIRGVFSNVNALLDDLGQDRIDVELVIHGAAIQALRRESSPHLEAIRKLAARGVSFAACANALKHQNLTAEDLTPEALVVSSAMGELTRRQSEGWAYIRP